MVQMRVLINIRDPQEMERRGLLSSPLCSLSGTEPSFPFGAITLCEESVEG